MKKKKWFWYYYFLIGLPLAFYGVFIWQPKPYVEEYPEIFKSIDKQLELITSGTYSLYDIGEKREIGTLEIEVRKNLGEIVVNGKGLSTSGEYDFSTFKYDFKETDFDEIVFTPFKIDGYVVWFSSAEDKSYVLTVVKNEWFDSEYKDQKGYLFIISKIPKDRMDYYLREDRPVQTNNSIFLNAYGAEYSGVLIVHKEERDE